MPYSTLLRKYANQENSQQNNVNIFPDEENYEQILIWKFCLAKPIFPNSKINFDQFK